MLDKNRVSQLLEETPNWALVGQKIQRQFELPSFEGAIEFTNKIANASERVDHHPDILIHNWNKVTVTLTTHSEGGLTSNDFSLARQISKIFSQS